MYLPHRLCSLRCVLEYDSSLAFLTTSTLVDERILLRGQDR
jgi:hypothetical protein